MFKTPTLRNVATRQVFFHNGRFHTLKEALRFYVERDTDPDEWYPHGGPATACMRFMICRLGWFQRRQDYAAVLRDKNKRPVWNDGEINDVIAFLKTLSDEDQISNHR